MSRVNEKATVTKAATILLPIWMLLASSPVSAAAMQRPPNIVLVLADDLGAHDLGCYGADLHETPWIDQLAEKGMRFTQSYAAAPVCSPTRAALLTGQHPARLRITIWAEGSLKGPKDRELLQAQSLHDLPHAQTTLAKYLQNAGYMTAIVGKWHLGGASHAPETHGFDVNIGGTHWGAPTTYFFPYRGSGRFGAEFRYVPHLEFGQPGEYLTDRLTDEALRVIDHAGDRPFFLYLAHHAPHTPIEAKSTDVENFESKVRPESRHQNATYAAMVKSVDDSVGRIFDHLKSRGLEENTVFIFTSDNGGFLGGRRGADGYVTSNAPLRSGKGTLYEGGVRVPLIVRWPGVTKAGSESDQPVVLTDLFPTLLAAAQLSMPDQPSDGVDLSGLLRDPGATLDRVELFFHFPHYYHAPPSAPACSIRTNDWKLIEFFEDDNVELYNLRQDPSEEKDLALSMPDKAAELRQRLQEWRKSLNAAMPKANPDYRPTTDQ